MLSQYKENEPNPIYVCMDIKKDSYHHYVNDKTIDQWNCVCVCVCVCVFPGGSDGKASAHSAGDTGWIPGLGRFPWRRKWQPTPVLLPEKFHGLRSLVGYSPWARKELDTTERLHFHFANYTCTYKHVFL